MEEKKTLDYSAAIAEIEKILARFGDGSIDVDTLATEVKRAAGLIKMCKERLLKAEKELGEVLAEKE